MTPRTREVLWGRILRTRGEGYDYPAGTGYLLSYGYHSLPCPICNLCRGPA